MPRKNEGKKASLNIKIQPAVLEEYQAACKLRGATMSGILSLRIEQVIREEKTNNPTEFARVLSEIRAREADERSRATTLPIPPDTLIVEDVYMSSPEGGGKVSDAVRKDIADAKAAVRKFKSKK